VFLQMRPGTVFNGHKKELRGSSKVTIACPRLTGQTVLLCSRYIFFVHGDERENQDSRGTAIIQANAHENREGLARSLRVR
jgi:hypothetical protein